MFHFSRAKRIPGLGASTVALAAVFLFFSLFPRAMCAGGVVEDEKGIYLGLRFIGSSLHVDDTSGQPFFIKDDGGGLQLDFGYRFNPAFALELTLGGSNHETSDPAVDAAFQFIQIFGFYRFCPGRPFRPYLKGGLGGYALNVEEGSARSKINGGGVAVGGGFRFFFSSHFSIGVDFTHNFINYEHAELGFEGFSYEWEIDEEGSMTSIGVMFAYSF